MSWHARAPVRIDFAGGWTDVPQFAEREGGIVVNAAITRYVRVDVLPGGDGIRLHAEDLHQHVRYPSSGMMRYDGRLDLHKAALNMLPVTGGVEVLSRTDLPVGSGLGGSGALDVALVAALALARREWHDQRELAELGFHLEAVELKLLGGRQDQYAAALGGFNQLVFGMGGGVQLKRLEVSRERAGDLARHLVLAYTGESHFSSATHRRVWAAYQGGEATVLDALRVMRDVAGALGKSLEAGDWVAAARLVDENWRQQRRLDATISTPNMQVMERAAREAGAWGLKATGAGAGGCLLILCPADSRERVVGAVQAAGADVLDAGFDFDGATTWEEDAGGDAG